MSSPETTGKLEPPVKPEPEKTLATGSEQELYDQAKKLFDAGDRENARAKFETFIQKYPKSQNADNARFWIADTYYRPYSESVKEDMQTNPIYNYILLTFFLINPLFIITAFNETKHITPLLWPFMDNPLVSVLGLLILCIGGIITVTGRAQLSRFGTGVLQIEEEHKLVTTGIYRVLRHPIYAGGIAVIFGLLLTFRGVISALAVTIVYFFVFRHRLVFEERLLVQEFGDEYIDYMRKTWRLIPYVY